MSEVEKAFDQAAAAAAEAATRAFEAASNASDAADAHHAAARALGSAKVALSARRTFVNPSMQRLYDLRRASPPSRATSGGVAAAYFVGLTLPHTKPRFARSSLAYAAWAAGVDTARAAARFAAQPAEPAQYALF